MCFLHAIWRFMNPGLRVVFFSLVSGPQFRVSKSMSLETLTLMWLIWRIVGLYIHDYSSRFVRFCWRLEKKSSQVRKSFSTQQRPWEDSSSFFSLRKKLNKWIHMSYIRILVGGLDQFLLFHSVGNVIIPTDELSLSLYIYIYDRRKFRSQTSDNMDRWKAEQGRGREKRKIPVEERRSEKRKSQKKEDADTRK